MASKAGKILGTIAPIAAAFIPGVGPLLSAGIGAASGALTGGGLKGALLGAASGGLGSYLNAGLSAGGGLSNSLFGQAAHTLGAGVQGPVTAATSGLIGSGGKLLGMGLGGSGAGSSFGSALFSGLNSLSAQSSMEDDLLKSQENSMAALSPYLESGKAANSQLSGKLASGELGGEFNPGDLTTDPGYQFRLAEGNKAIDRSQSARGNYFSGAALKAAQDYGQGLADQTYNDAHSRWLQDQQNTYGMLSGQSGAGQNAANSAAGIYDNQGNIKANATLAGSNVINSTLSQILSGGGARHIVGYKSDGTPIYSDDGKQTVIVR